LNHWKFRADVSEEEEKLTGIAANGETSTAGGARPYIGLNVIDGVDEGYGADCATSSSSWASSQSEETSSASPSHDGDSGRDSGVTEFGGVTTILGADAVNIK